MLRRLSGLGVAGAVLLVAACGGTSQTDIERNLAAELERHVAPAVIENVDCPEEAPLTSGSEFLCDAQVEGQYYETQINIIDAQGRFEIQRRHAVLNVIRTEASLAADANYALNRDLVADCGDTQYLVVLVGRKVNCTLTDTASGQSQEVNVLVTSPDATFEWSIEN